MEALNKDTWEQVSAPRKVSPHRRYKVLNKTIDISLSVRYNAVIRYGMLNSLIFTDSSFNALFNSDIRLPMLHMHILLDVYGAGDCRFRAPWFYDRRITNRRPHIA